MLTVLPWYEHNLNCGNYGKMTITALISPKKSFYGIFFFHRKSIVLERGFVMIHNLTRLTSLE